MKKVILTIAAVLTLISCADKTQVQLENKIGELSLEVGSSSVAIDYEIVSYSVIDSITTRKENGEYLEFTIAALPRQKKGLADVLVSSKEYGYDATDIIASYEARISDSKAKIKELEAIINDDVIAIAYTVVIEYYNPILKVDVTQKKRVVLSIEDN